MMYLKKKFSLFFILGILSLCFLSCSDDSKDELTSYAQLSDVVLKQSVNGTQSLTLTSGDETITFSSQLSFDDKTINWSRPTLEQSFNNIFDISKENISITDSEGATVPSINISVDNNRVTVSFVKIGNSYDYMTSSTFTINIRTKIKDGTSAEDLAKLKDNGLISQSIFYGESAEQSIKSNTIEITSKVNTDINYSIKGDPNNDKYQYKLNVVYFIPSDIVANPNYKERISTILLKHQLFICKWMKHWGYEEKSFGLPLDENGMIEIVIVQGEGKKADYPYSSSISAGKMIAEVKKHYADNNLTFKSEHTLILTATNGDVSETPFYGYGKWCFAIDYPGMSYDLYNIDPITNQPMNSTPLTTNLIGGLLHELGHGLNEPHVGSTYSQKNDPAFGMTLMGAGNTTYGKKPTFMHPASAAIMNNCQISSFTNKTFYGTTTSSINITNVNINGDKCTVKGSYTASVKVTDIIVRFYNATETFLGGSSGYTSVAFVTKPTGNTFELTVPIEEMRVNTFDYKVGVTILMENGTTKSISAPYTYKLVNTGSGYTFQSEDVSNDGSWEVTTSHNLPKDDAISNAPGSLIDGNLSTSLSMVKPGKTYGGITVAATDIVFATINFKKQTEFNTVTLTNRNLQPYLNTKAVSFYGSNDGITFSAIKTGIALPNATVNTITFDTAVKYQYLKMTFDEWDKSSGSTMQFAELGLKNKK